MSDGLPFERCGVADEDGEIVGFVHFEDNPTFNYVQIRPGYERVSGDLVDWASSHLGGRWKRLGADVLGIFVSDVDFDLEQRVAERGFEPDPDVTEDHARYVIESEIAPPAVPDGFRLIGLDEENDLTNINRVLWRGFDHPGEPPESEVAARQRSQEAPHFRRDLTVAAVAPNGEYAAFCGMWTVPDNGVAYVEPVATDPFYRRQGLGTAVVAESMRRVAAEGIRVVWVGSGLPFYQDMGFNIRNRSRLWYKLI